MAGAGEKQRFHGAIALPGRALAQLRCTVAQRAADAGFGAVFAPRIHHLPVGLPVVVACLVAEITQQVAVGQALHMRQAQVLRPGKGSPGKGSPGKGVRCFILRNSRNSDIRLQDLSLQFEQLP